MRGFDHGAAQLNQGHFYISWKRAPLVASLDRCTDADFSRATIVLGAAHLAYVRARGEGRDLAIIVERTVRNTAQTIALEAAQLLRGHIMLVYPSDHRIKNVQVFTAAAKLAQEA